MTDFSVLGVTLTKAAQKRILGGYYPTPDCFNDACQGGGGGSSCWHDADWINFDCSLNQSQAQQMQQQNGGLWCTASCCTSCRGPVE